MGAQAKVSSGSADLGRSGEPGSPAVSGGCWSGAAIPPQRTMQSVACPDSAERMETRSACGLHTPPVRAEHAEQSDIPEGDDGASCCYGCRRSGANLHCPSATEHQMFGATLDNSAASASSGIVAQCRPQVPDSAAQALGSCDRELFRILSRPDVEIGE